jgi:testis-specific serine kinase
MEAGSNRLKLTDFGFSTDDTSRLSTTFCGSKAYAAPELIRAVPYSPQVNDGNVPISGLQNS